MSTFILLSEHFLFGRCFDKNGLGSIPRQELYSIFEVQGNDNSYSIFKVQGDDNRYSIFEVQGDNNRNSNFEIQGDP